jgi:hypothetical protein
MNIIFDNYKLIIVFVYFNLVENWLCLRCCVKSIKLLLAETLHIKRYEVLILTLACNISYTLHDIRLFPQEGEEALPFNFCENNAVDMQKGKQKL